jgi:hypothetical protein
MYLFLFIWNFLNYVIMIFFFLWNDYDRLLSLLEYNIYFLLYILKLDYNLMLRKTELCYISAIKGEYSKNIFLDLVMEIVITIQNVVKYRDTRQCMNIFWNLRLYAPDGKTRSHVSKAKNVNIVTKKKKLKIWFTSLC